MMYKKRKIEETSLTNLADGLNDASLSLSDFSCCDKKGK